jgi:flagellar biosynthetic protein FliQ
VTEQIALDTARHAILVAIALAGPPLVVALVIGVVVSLFQAMTQVNEMALSFIPKLVAVIAVLGVLGPWMLQTAVTYTAAVIEGLPNLVH